MNKMLKRPIFQRFLRIRSVRSPRNKTLVVDEDVLVGLQGSPLLENGTIKTIYDIYEHKKAFKLWNRVHSEGQGYIRFNPDNLSLASSGTIDNAAVLELEQEKESEEFNFVIKSGSKSYYFCCENDNVKVSEDSNKATKFTITAGEVGAQYTQHNLITFTDRSGKKKMLTIGSGDTLISKERVECQRFMGPACFFVIDLS